MNTLENSCFRYDGSDDSKNIIRIMNKNHRSNFKGNDKYFYWIANNIADTFYKMDKDLTEIPPYDYLALLTQPKRLTVEDLKVKIGEYEYVLSTDEIKEGYWFIHESHNIKRVYKCEKIIGKSIVIDNSNSSCWTDYSKKIIATNNPELIADGVPETLPVQDTFIADHDKLSLQMANEEIAHLQQQLKEANLLLLNIKNTIELNNIQKVFPETYSQINQFLTRNK